MPFIIKSLIISHRISLNLLHYLEFNSIILIVIFGVLIIGYYTGMKNESQEESIGLLDIVDLKFLQDFQDAFAKSVNVASIMVDNIGPITKPSNFTDFCIKYTRGSEEGYKRCNECDIKWGKIAAERGEPIIYNCHSGLTDFAVPIMLNGKHIASILGGQVLTYEPDENHFRKIANELGINEDEYIEALKKIKIVPKEQVEAAAKLLFLTANSISEIAHKNYELMKKRQRDDLLNKIIDVIRNTVDIEEIKKYLIKTVGEYFHVDRCFFVDYDKSTEKFLPIKTEVLKSSGFKSLIGLNSEEEFPEFCHRLKNKKNIIIKDVEKITTNKLLNNNKSLDYLLANNTKSDYALLLQHANQIVGVLVLHFVENKKTLTSEQLDLLKAIQYQVGLAIYQNRLLEEKKQIAENEKCLRQVMLSSSSTFNFEQIIKSIVTETGKLFNADRCFFVETDLATNKNLPIKDYAEYLSSPDIESHTKVTPEKSDTEVFIDLTKVQKIICVENINDIDLPESTKHMLIDKLSTKSYMIVSVKYDETIYGALVLHYVNEYKKFSSNDISLAEAMANQSANIINQVKLYDKIQKTFERETILRKIIEITRNSLNINEVKEQIVNELGKAFKADRCYFRSYDKIQDKFFPPDIEYLSSSDVKSLLNVEPNQEGLKYFSNELRKRVQGFYPVVANEDIAKGTPLEAYMKNAEMKADYAMPIADDDEGFIWLVLHYSYKDPELDNDYKKLLETIAFQVDTALRQIKLNNKTIQQMEREKAILSNLPFMVWLKDKDSRLLAVNEPYANMCKTSIENVISKTDYDFFPKENADLYVADDKEVMKLGKTKSVEELIDGPEGARWHETYKTPLFNEKGEIVGTTGFSRDITERKEIDRMKSEFVSTVSHELRTPLTSLSGALELILSGRMGDFSDKINSLLNMAHNNCHRLTNLINDILDIEKIEAGKMDFEIKPLELMPLISQVIQLNLQYAQKFNVEIRLTEMLQNVLIQADANRLIQVITNLLSNAIKFSTPNIPVEVSVIRINDNIRISVTNYGTEIPEEFKSRIFQKFAQADSSDSRQKGGTGLGLSICKLIIEKMNGHIDFISKNNKTTFYFDLPEFTKEQRGSIDEKTCSNM